MSNSSIYCRTCIHEFIKMKYNCDLNLQWRVTGVVCGSFSKEFLLVISKGVIRRDSVFEFNGGREVLVKPRNVLEIISFNIRLDPSQ